MPYGHFKSQLRAWSRGRTDAKYFVWSYGLSIDKKRNHSTQSDSFPICPIFVHKFTTPSNTITSPYVGLHGESCSSDSALVGWRLTWLAVSVSVGNAIFKMFISMFLNVIVLSQLQNIGKIYWLIELRFTSQSTGHFGDVLAGHITCLILRKLNLTEY